MNYPAIRSYIRFFSFFPVYFESETKEEINTYVGRVHVYIYFWVRFEQSTVAMYGGISKLFITHIRFYLLFCFTVKVLGTKTEHSDVATYGGRIHVYIFIWVLLEQSTVATYGGISKLFTIHIRIYLFFRFTEKVRGTKTEHSDVATYGGRIHVYIYLRVRLFF